MSNLVQPTSIYRTAMIKTKQAFWWDFLYERH